ncbi:hypothetical protein BH11MYX1_BH11MYX1_36970 [soil metagenome]
MSEPLLACLPEPLRAGAVITVIASGLSGAGVYRVVANDQVYVLKVAGTDESLGAWERRLALHAAVSEAGLSPAVVHSDPGRRALLSAFVLDRSFPARFATPQTRELALVELADLLRRAHAVPVPPGTPRRLARDEFVATWDLVAEWPIPAFARHAIERALAAVPPASGRSPGLSHNDVNPSNLVWDGERVWLLDWESAGVNDPLYDLAAVSMFLRMDDATSARLIAAHDRAAPAPLPAAFRHLRRFIAAFVGSLFLRLARANGHLGTVEGSPLTLTEVYLGMREGTLDPRRADGQWRFALAMLRTSAEL